MSTGLFVLINLALLILIGRWIWAANRRPDPSGFRVGDDGEDPPPPANPRQRGSVEPPGSAARPGERSLNCWFQYNGHAWDAFESLGVPAGADQAMCREAYEKMRRDPGKGELAAVAWAALQERFRASSR